MKQLIRINEPNKKKRGLYRLFFFNLPNAWEEPAKQKGAVALDEGGEEGEDTIDGERDEKRLPTAYPVSQSPPEESPNHHPEIYNQTCGQSRAKEAITHVNITCQCLLKEICKICERLTSDVSLSHISALLLLWDYRLCWFMLTLLAGCLSR